MYKIYIGNAYNYPITTALVSSASYDSYDSLTPSFLENHVVVFGWSCHVVVVGCGHVVVVGVVHVVVVVGGGVVVHVVVVVFGCQVVVVGCSGQVVVLGGQFLFILFNFLL